jgi:tartrate dehydrogenase/decarboxylase / D-malate dehydrogenase
MPTSSFDRAAALAGSLGIAPTANLDPERRFSSMFEPIHGSAFDIAGQGIANPIGTFWSATLMLAIQGQSRFPAGHSKLRETISAVHSSVCQERNLSVRFGTF